VLQEQGAALAVERDLERLPPGDRVLARGAQEGRDRARLGAGPRGVRGAAHRGADQGGGHREDGEDHNQLHEGVAPR
jgi:hypothetical protein